MILFAISRYFGWCVAIIIAFFQDSFSFFKNSNNFTKFLSSRLLPGSSRIIISGLWTNARIIFTLSLCPIESDFTGIFSNFFISKNFIISSYFCKSGLIFEKFCKNKIFSFVVISSKNGPPTKAYQKAFCRSVWKVWKVILPFFGFKSCPRICKKVVFPTHEGPYKAKKSPSWIFSEIFSKSGCSYECQRFLKEMRGIFEMKN